MSRILHSILLVGLCSVAQPSLAQIAIIPWDVKVACSKIDTQPYSKANALTIEQSDHKKLTFMVELADSESERSQGLMCRETMPNTKGMLFAFQDNDERSFWMKNTLIPLDIIYIDTKGKIVSIQKNAVPLDRTPLPSHGKAVAVLEINGGLSDQMHIKIGDKVKYSYFKAWH